MKILKSSIAGVLVGVAFALVTSVSAFADDWEAVKLRGAVFTFVENQWVQLARGDIVPDDRIIRTASKSRVQFRRGKETIDLGPDTQIRIFDHTGQQFTIVQEHFGDVAIEAERKNVQHFAVQTKFLAAVVKGTRFTVKADAKDASVKVIRGQVEVRDVARKLMVDITPGQSASAGGGDASLSVEGPGTLPQIVKFKGQALAEDVVALSAQDTPDAAFGANAGGNGNGNAYGLSKSSMTPGNSANSNAGGNSASHTSSSNAGGNSASHSSSSNAGGNSASHTSSSNASASSSSNNAGGNSNGAGNSANSHAGGNK